MSNGVRRENSRCRNRAVFICIYDPVSGDISGKKRVQEGAELETQPNK